jgi:hypothetical protein
MESIVQADFATERRMYGATSVYCSGLSANQLVLCIWVSDIAAAGPGASTMWMQCALHEHLLRAQPHTTPEVGVHVSELHIFPWAFS